MQPSSTFIGVTAAVGAVAILGSGVAAATPVEWKDCTDVVGTEAPTLPTGNTVQCGTLRVPVDYSKPDGRTTTIALTRVNATGQSRSTVFGNPGGPGNSALGYWLPRGDQPVPDGLYQDHDLVAVQPRGLAGSDPLACDPSRVGPVTQNALHDACYGTDSEYMRSLTTENAARDMDSVRDSLGLATIDYVGQSYGTAIGADYATLFPEHTGRFVLDSNTNPDWHWSRQAQETTLAQQGRVNDVFAWIAERDDYYHLGDTPLKVFTHWKWITDQEVGGAPNLTPPPAEERDLPVELRGTPLQQPVLDAVNTTAPARARAEGFVGAVTLRDATNNATTGLYDATVGATFSDRDWPMLAHVLKYYNDGGTIARVDPVTAAKIVDARENRTPYPRTDVSMFETVTCNEDSTPGNPLGVIAAKADAALGGNALTDKAAAQGAGGDCMGWAPVTTPVPTNGDGLAQKPMILNSEHDTRTPITGAERMQQLLGGTLVTVGGGDHGTFRSGNSAVDDAVMHFLDTGRVDQDALPGRPGPTPMPKWDAADRQQAAEQGMSVPTGDAGQTSRTAATTPATPAATTPAAPATPIPGADDFYGVHTDNGADPAQQLGRQADDAVARAQQAASDAAAQFEQGVGAVRSALTPGATTTPAPAPGR